jgi:hypothetical protein
MCRTQKLSLKRDAITVSYASLVYSVIANMLRSDVSVVKAFESALNLLKAQGYGR